MAELVGEALYEAVVNLESERGSASQARKRGAGTADGNSNTTAAATDDRLMPAAEVPPPMVPGNADSGPSTCFLQVRPLGPKSMYSMLFAPRLF